MANISKMRIIHSAEFNAEKEYLKTFFDYIGLLVYDEKIFDPQYANIWHNHFKIHNDSDGVDIVLNYYTDNSVPVSPRNKRIYLYFDLEKKICDIETKPLSNSRNLISNENMNIPKKDLRSKILDLLIDELWKDDIKNKNTIKLIKESYISKKESSDLFYILQAIYSYLDVANSYVITSHNKHMKNNAIETALYLNSYVVKFFEELWRMQCLLEYNDSPYAIYTTIHNSDLLSRLYFRLSEYQKKHLSCISYHNKLLQIKSYREIQCQIYELVRNCSWSKKFPKLMFKSMTFDVASKDVFNYLQSCISKSFFPYYYASVYNILGYKYIREERNNKKILEIFRKTLDITPNDYDANFRIGLLTTLEGEVESGKNYFRKILTNLGTDNLRLQNNKYYNVFSLSELFRSFQADIVLGKLSINTCCEYSARGAIIQALLYAEYYEEIPLMERIADKNEKAYQDFIGYHKYSLPVWALYTCLKPWVNDIIYDPASKVILQKRLSKWKDY